MRKSTNVDLATSDADEDLGKPPTSGEIAVALQKAANGKAPGESGITVADALKALEGMPFKALKDF
eukprot:scaffold23876_cov51-Attheya_sp.AAC.1